MNVKNWLLASIVMVALLSQAACSGIGQGTEDPLDGTSWVLAAYGQAAPLPGTRITATFEEGQVGGSSGCNSYGGSYEVKGDSISLSDIFMTEMACMDPEGVMEQERMYLEYLSGVETLRLSHGQLQMARPDGETLSFVSAE